MDDPLSKAKACHDQAEAFHAKARLERDHHRQRRMGMIAELYFLLHDELVALSKMPAPAASGDI
jgi:hypothetical protein